MAISGKFVADFSDFQAAVTSAETKLVSFETGANKVQASLERMENSLSGRKMIADATLMAQAVENVGGVSSLTDAELQRLGDSADEAIEKMKRMGVDVPPELQKISTAAAEARTGVEGIGEAAGTAAPKATGLAAAAKQFDGVLAAMGINIGPVIRGIEEIGAASGKSIAELGKLQTAGLALGAGLAGWGIGRAISGFIDLDKKIGDATAKLLGWGDVAGQEAAAGAETLARASANAGRRITDMSEAVKINEAAVVALQRPTQKTTFDIHAMREAMLKAEAARVVGPEAVPNVVALGKAASETTRNLSGLEAKMSSLDRLNASIYSRLQALNDDLDRSAAERLSTPGSPISVTRDIVGRVTPIAAQDASNTAKIEALIARLTREIAEFKLPDFLAPGGVGFEEAGRQQRDAAQRNADNIRQVEYLRDLLAAAPTASTSPLLPSTAIGQTFGRAPVVVQNTVQVNGVMDMRTIRDIKAVLDQTTMTTLSIGRQLGAN